MTQDDLIYVGLTRERAEALIEAARYAVGNPDFARVRADDMEPVTLGADDLRAALDQPAPERVEEYRVVRAYDGMAGMAFNCPLAEVEQHRAELEDEYGTRHRIQHRFAYLTPWKDMEESDG